MKNVPILIIFVAAISAQSLWGVDTSVLLDKLQVTGVTGYPPRIEGKVVGHAVPDDLSYSTITRPGSWSNAQWDAVLDTWEDVDGVEFLGFPNVNQIQFPKSTSLDVLDGDTIYSDVYTQFDYNALSNFVINTTPAVDLFYGEDVVGAIDDDHPAAIAFDFNDGQQFVMDFSSVAGVSWPNDIGAESMWEGRSANDIVYVPQTISTYNVFGYAVAANDSTTRYVAYRLEDDVDTFRPSIDATFTTWRTSPGIGSTLGYARSETPRAVLEDYLRSTGGGTISNVLYSREANTTANTANGKNAIVHGSVANTMSTYINWYAMAFLLVELDDGSVQGWIVPSSGYNAWTSSGGGAVANTMSWGVPAELDMSKFFTPPTVVLAVE